MILTYELGQKYHSFILEKLCCPICLSPLFHYPIDKRTDHLSCKSCTSTFVVLDRVPILLINDDNWRKKHDEIEGEIRYNVDQIPQDIHLQRNTFVDKNTKAFLSESKTDLSKDDTLIVGCSMAELELFSSICKRVICLDIVPFFTKSCLEATQERSIQAAWVCGDGECLPFEDESFNSIIVRQTLHHMIKYYSAICEFFRVCKVGGQILVIDEPFVSPDLNDSIILSLLDDISVYRGMEFGQIRDKLKIQSGSVSKYTFKEKQTPYIKPEAENPETFLADKYHCFSLLNLIFAILHHTDDFQIFWPKEIAWMVGSGKSVRFHHGANPNYKKCLRDKLVSSGNVSLSGKKTARTSVFRNRSDIAALTLESIYKLPGSWP